MAGFDVGRVIAAFQAGRQIKDQKEQKARDLEDREYALKRRAALDKAEKIELQMAKRRLDQETVAAMQGQPGEEITIPGFSAAPTPGGPVDQGLGMIPLQSAALPGADVPAQVRDLPLQAQQISGVPELGVPGYSTTPRSMQEMLRTARGEKAFESQLKREESAVELPGGIVVDKSIAPSIINAQSAGVRQADQQAFTAKENEARLKAESEKAKEDRASRERIAAANRLQTAVNAAKSGSQSKAVQQALSESARFDSNQIVKNYAVIQEGLNAAKSMATGGTSADDIGLLYAFAKAMDPNSVVREGEYATVQKYAQSWAQQFGFQAARIFTNSQFLTAEARKNMISVIEKKASAAKSSYENLRTSAAKKIGNVGEDPEKWLGNYSLDSGGWEVIP